MTVVIGVLVGLVVGYGAGRIGLKNIGVFFKNLFARKKVVAEKVADKFDDVKEDVVEGYENAKNKFK